MILIDATQICIASIAITMATAKPKQLTDGFVRHIVLNSIRANVKKFRPNFGNKVVLAFDGAKSWRKEVFPHYKAHRAKAREESVMDWTTIFKYLEMVREEVRENLPYTTLHLDFAEADDIIAVLAKAANEPTVIVSNDKDFHQLINSLVTQYTPKSKHFVYCADPENDLKALIIDGDKGDGVPNILSADTTFVMGKRQRPITAQKFQKYIESNPEDYEEEVFRNFKRNQTLIDFDYIPKNIVMAIEAEYKTQAKNKADRMKMLNYFARMKLRDLLESANDF